jgi:aspartokinase-like uncharacterized kinase
VGVEGIYSGNSDSSIVIDVEVSDVILVTDVEGIYSGNSDSSIVGVGKDKSEDISARLIIKKLF